MIHITQIQPLDGNKELMTLVEFETKYFDIIDDIDTGNPQITLQESLFTQSLLGYELDSKESKIIEYLIAKYKNDHNRKAA